MKTSTLYFLALNLATLDSTARAYDQDGISRAAKPIERLPAGVSSSEPSTDTLSSTGTSSNTFNTGVTTTPTAPTTPTTTHTTPTAPTTTNNPVPKYTEFAPAKSFFKLVKRAPQNQPSSNNSGPLMPSASGHGVIQGDIVIGGGIFPTMSLGGVINGNNNGLGAGASTTIGVGGHILPTVAVGGGASDGINNLAINGAVSGTALEGGWLGGLVPAANTGFSVGGEGGVQLSNGLHGFAGANGGAWGTLGYGGIFRPSSTLAGIVGGNVNLLFGNNAKQTPAPAPTTTP